jgi:hypothetical protein
MANDAFVVRANVLGIPVWIVRRVLDFVRWVLIVLAVFVALSCLVQGALLASMLSALAAVALKFGLQPWRVFENEFTFALAIFASAVVFLIGGMVGLMLNRPIYLAREAAEARTAALSTIPASANTPAHASSAAAPTQYHYITGLDPNGDNWLALRSEPGLKLGSRLMKMGPETLLTVLERKGAWARVRTSAGDIGWTSSKYIACCRNTVSAAPDSSKPKPDQSTTATSGESPPPPKTENQWVSYYGDYYVTCMVTDGIRWYTAINQKDLTEAYVNQTPSAEMWATMCGNR